ncbi:MAG: hypothetical protein LM522_11905, partial [Candidatus Contendobacter sp.]|nr:hypothetical protein [Candidatus Contendobacter sp.]
PLEPGLDGLRGIHLNYRLPRTGATDDTTCPLDLKVLGTRASRTFQICPPAAEGYLFLPFARLSDGQALDLGTVSDLEWTLRSPPSSKGEGLGVREPAPATNPGHTADPAAFALDFTVEGFTERSAEQQLADTPLFTVSGKPVRVAPPSSDEEQPLLRPWRALPPAVLQDLLATQGQIANSDHPWFYVERIVAEPTPPLPLETWLALTQPPEPPTVPPRWPQWLALLAVAAALWLGWRRRWWQRGWAALGDRGRRLADGWRASLQTVWQDFQVLGRAIAQRLVRWAVYGHTAIGLVALIPGLWWAGQLGFTTEGLLVLIAALLTAAAAVRHRRIALAGTLTVSPSSARPMPWTLMAGAFALWWLGWSIRNTPAQSWGWGYLPLGVALYWEWETPKRFVRTVGQAGWRMLAGHRQLLRNILRLLVWGGLTAFLYRRGLTTSPASGENYAFTFGGMTAVMTLRALLLTFEPLARRWLPGAAGTVYGGAGSLHFSGALLMLIATAITLALKREALAEQLAIIVYYGLVAGTVKELITLRRRSGEGTKESAC